MIAKAQSRPIKFAAILPLTGAFAFAGNAALDAMRDATDRINDGGGIGGRRFELIVEDDGYDVARGTAAFNRIVQRESADELVFMYGNSTGLSKAIAPEITRLELPYTATSFSNELADPKTYPTIYVFGPTYNDMMGALFSQIQRQRGRGAKIFLCYSNSEFGRDPIAFAKAQAARRGFQIVGEEVTPLAIADASPIVAKIRQANPDFVIAHGYVLTVEPLLVRAAREQGVRSTFMGTYYSAELALMQRAGAASNGFVVAYHNAYYYDTLVPAVEQIRALRRAKGRDLSYRTTYYMGTWAAMDIIAEAMRRASAAGQLTRPGMIRALDGLGDYNAGGQARNLRWVDRRLPFTKLYRANVADGRFDALTDWIDGSKA
ncbi:MAG: ABC transporter substrate-binding protein [Meiothermus sp.]|nr:ABC transporter substrate-binding protein [Meiothermus sp.]